MTDLAGEAASLVTEPTRLAQVEGVSLVEEMRKTGTLTKIEQAERLEEIVQDAAQETRLQEEEMKA